MMKIEIVDGKIRIDVRDLLENIGLSECAEELVNHLGCQDAVIKMVADQIIHGCTEEGWHGAKTYGHNPGTPLTEAIRAVANASSEVAAEEIGRLVSLCESKEETNQKLWVKVRNLEEANRGLMDRLHGMQA
jgi:hypothetical protein